MDMKAEALALRRKGLTIGEIADRLFPDDLPCTSDNKVQKLLSEMPRCLRFKCAGLVERDAAFPLLLGKASSAKNPAP